MSKLVEVQVAPDDLEFLKANQYALCFAKHFDGDNTVVVWQAFSNYLQNNPFGWPSQHQVFGTSAFNVGSVVTVDTNTVAIGPNQQTTLNTDAVFQPPVSAPLNGGFVISNLYRQEIHVGISSTSTGLDGVQRSTPVFVTPAPAPPFFNFEFTPLDIVRVWFQQNAVTSEVVVITPANTIEVDLQRRDFGKLLYKGGKWSEQPGPWSNTL